MTLPFDPIERSHEIEQIVMCGDKRMYYRFRFAKFYGGVATADTIGCNLLCCYCWNFSRNLNPGKSGVFYSPSQVSGKLLGLAERHSCDQFRISGAEPILGKESAQHLAEVIKHVDGHFIVETNGVMLGADQSLIEILEPLPNIHVRLCIKAHHGLDFEKITGAKADGFACQLMAAESLKKARIEHSIAIMAPFVDPRKLPCHVHEVEELISYKSTLKNLKQRGISIH
jgi:uncharacterized Fe-S cluster-containing radical SAM superfamily protein